jgi:hypothetical protein
MSDPEDNWPLPNYSAGPPKHLHAFGVISTVYNAFEEGMFLLYRHHLDLFKVPYELSEFFYLSLNDNQRLVAIQKVFYECDKDPLTISAVENLIEYFRWCWDVRNKLAHAEHYPAALGGKPGKWHLTKRMSKRNPDRGYMEFELATIRDMADKIELGKKHCARLRIYLRVRDVPESQLPPDYKAYVDEPLPERLDLPDSLEISPRP